MWHSQCICTMIIIIHYMVVLGTQQGSVNSPAIFQDLEDIVSECIPVLLEESINVVVHLSSVVSDAKLRIVYFRFHIVRIILHRRQMFFDTNPYYHTFVYIHVLYIHTCMCKCAGIM